MTSDEQHPLASTDAVICHCHQRPATRRIENPAGSMVYLMCQQCAWMQLDKPGWRDADIEDERGGAGDE